MRGLVSVVVCALATTVVRAEVAEDYPYVCQNGEQVVVTDTIGYVSYPGTRNHRWRYEPNENRCWRFSCAHSVVVTWDRVDMEEGDDFVETYSRKGSQYYTRDSQLTGRFEDEGPISYEGDVVFRIVSDGRVEKTGFDITFVCGTAAPTSNVPTPAPPTDAPSVVPFPDSCGVRNVVTEDGVISHAGTYKANQNICWLLQCEAVVGMDFSLFITEPTYDVLAVSQYEGNVPTVVKEMSGPLATPFVVSAAGHVLLHFTSDYSIQESGFILAHTCGAATTSGAPATNPPVTNPPVTNPPATNPPATNPPATNPPATNPPATDPPATNPPATNPPVTNPPATNPPATDPPATNPPDTIAPTNAPAPPGYPDVCFGKTGDIGHDDEWLWSDDIAVGGVHCWRYAVCSAGSLSKFNFRTVGALTFTIYNEAGVLIDTVTTEGTKHYLGNVIIHVTLPDVIPAFDFGWSCATTDAPATDPPATDPPATDPPATNPPATIAPTNAPAPPGYPDVCFGTSGDIGVDDEWLWSDSLSMGGAYCWRYAVCSAGSLSKFNFRTVGALTFTIYNEAGMLIDTVTTEGTKHYLGNVIIHVTLPDVIPAFDFGWSCATTDAPATNPPDTIAPTNAPAPPGYPDVCFGTSGDIGVDDEWLWSDSLSMGGTYCWRYAVCSAGSLSKFNFRTVGALTFTIYNEAGMLIDTVTTEGTKHYLGNVIIHVTLPDVIPAFDFGWSCATTDAPATNPPATIAPTNAPAPPGYPDVCFGTSGDIGVDDEWLWSDSLSMGGAYCWRYAVCSAGSLSKFNFRTVGALTFTIYNEAGVLIDTVTTEGTKHYLGNVIIHVTLPDVIPAFDFGWSCATTDAPATNPPATIAPTNAPAPPGYPDVCFGTSGDIGHDDEWLWSDSLSMGGAYCWRYAVCSAGSMSKFNFRTVGALTFTIYNEAGVLIDTVTTEGTKHYLGNVIIHVTLPDVIPAFDFGWSCATTNAPATNPPDTIAPTNAPAPPGYPDVCFGTSGDIGVDDEWLWSDSLSMGGTYCWRYAVCSAGSMSKFNFRTVGALTFTIYNEAGMLIDTVTTEGTKHYLGNVIIHATLPDVIPAFDFGWSCATTNAPATNPPDTIAPTAPPGYPDVCVGTSREIGQDDEWLWYDALSVGGVHCFRYAVCSEGSMSRFNFRSLAGQTFFIYNEAGVLIDTVTTEGTKYYLGNVVIHVILPDVIPQFDFGWGCTTTNAPDTNVPAPPGYPSVCTGKTGTIGDDDEWFWSDFLAVGGVHCWQYSQCASTDMSKFNFRDMGGQTFSIYDAAGTLIDTVTADGTKHYLGTVVIYVNLPDVIPSFNFGWSCATTPVPV